MIDPAKNAIKTDIEDRERAASIAPNNLAKRLKLAKTYEKYDKLDLATSAYQSVVRLNPRHADAHYALGRLHFLQGQFEDAKRGYQTAISILPDVAPPYAGLAKVYHIQSNLDLAEANYRAAVEHDPQLAVAHAGLGTIAYQQNQISVALKAYQKAIEVDPDAHYAMIGIAQIYLDQQKQTPDACRLAQQACQLKAAPQYFSTLADTHFQLGQIDSALNAIQTAVQIDPANQTYRSKLAEIQALSRK